MPQECQTAVVIRRLMAASFANARHRAMFSQNVSNVVAHVAPRVVFSRALARWPIESTGRDTAQPGASSVTAT